MGSGRYSEAFYASATVQRLAETGTTFTHTADVRAGRVEAKTHDKLNIKGKRREARDSADHPHSTPIGVVFDVTGSMSLVPAVFQRNLGALVKMLTDNGVVPGPQVLFAAVGDAYSDQAPLQVGQFEADNRMDDDLSVIYLEGKGGGGICESYELGAYFFARRVDTDGLDKRHEKGHLFFIGDEMPYAKVTAVQVQQLIGDTLQDDVPTAQIFAELKDKWHVHFLMPGGTQHGSGQNADTQQILIAWRQLLGNENVSTLPDADKVCGEIATIVGLRSGRFADRATAEAALAVSQAQVATAMANASAPGGTDRL